MPFAASQILVFSKQKHAFLDILLNLKANYCFVIHEVQPFKMVLNFKIHLKKIYRKHYFKMRKILTGAKLLLMSIYNDHIARQQQEGRLGVVPSNLLLIVCYHTKSCNMYHCYKYRTQSDIRRAVSELPCMYPS